MVSAIGCSLDNFCMVDASYEENSEKTDCIRKCIACDDSKSLLVYYETHRSIKTIIDNKIGVQKKTFPWNFNPMERSFFFYFYFLRYASTAAGMVNPFCSRSASDSAGEAPVMSPTMRIMRSRSFTFVGLRLTIMFS